MRTRSWSGREQPRYTAAVEQGDFDTAVWAGEGIDLIREVAPAGEIVRRLVAAQPPGW